MPISAVLFKANQQATPETWMDSRSATAAAADITAPKTAMLANGVLTTGTGTSGGGGYGYTLLGSKEFTVNTSSTSSTEVGSLEIGSSAWTKDKIIYVRVRDKAGKRAGYFYGSDAYFFNKDAANNNPTSISAPINVSLRFMSTNVWSMYSGTAGYGVYGYYLNDQGIITIMSRYSSTYSLTVNGIFVCEVYALDWPDGISPFNA